MSSNGNMAPFAARFAEENQPVEKQLDLWIQEVNV